MPCSTTPRNMMSAPPFLDENPVPVRVHPWMMTVTVGVVPSGSRWKHGLVRERHVKAGAAELQVMFTERCIKQLTEEGGLGPSAVPV